MLRSPLARCSSPDLRLHQTTTPAHEAASPSPPRSNSFVSSRRSGIVSEQDVLRLASVAAFDRDDPRRVDPRLAPRTAAAAVQTPNTPWPAPVLRRRSNDSEQRQPRPLSTGFLPSNTAAGAAVESQAAHRVHHGQQVVKANGVAETEPRLQNVALLPNRQLIQQPGTSGLLPHVRRYYCIRFRPSDIGIQENSRIYNCLQRDNCSVFTFDF